MGTASRSTTGRIEQNADSAPIAQVHEAERPGFLPSEHADD